MEQAGINYVQLIENKEITLKFAENGAVLDALRNDGAFIEILPEFPINLTITETRGNNGKINYQYEIEFIDISAENINKIRRSIYGFIAILNNEKIIPIPLIYNSAIQNNNTSASYSTKIINFVKTDKKILPFNNNALPWILDTGFWNDDAFWVDSANWND